MIIQSKNVWFDEKFQPLQIEIEDAKIVCIYAYGEKKADFDYGDKKVLPGLIDIHNHGWNGHDCTHATKEWIKEWRNYMLSEGVTSFVPTSSTNDLESILESMKLLSEDALNNSEGCQVLGIYSEGPFISKAKPGAQPPEWLLVPTKEIIDKFQEACHGLLIYVMLAPEELKGNYDVIEYMTKKGIRVTIGHTNANFDECEGAIKAGATSFTHTFNGMPPFKNREQGPVASAMYHKDLYAELIGDAIHVDKITAKIFADIKGKDRLISVTDSTRVKGLPVGHYELFGRGFNVTEEGICRLDNGTISGSCHSLSENLNTEIKTIGIDEVTAINSVTINPCRMLGIKNKGLIKVGYDADIAVFDENYKATDVFVKGQKKI